MMVERSTGVRYPQLADGEWLRQRYLTDQASARTIAAEIGCSQRAVLLALQRNGIPVRARGGTDRFGPVEVSTDRARANYEYMARHADAGRAFWARKAKERETP